MQVLHTHKHCFIQLFLLLQTADSDAAAEDDVTTDLDLKHKEVVRITYVGEITLYYLLLVKITLFQKVLFNGWITKYSGCSLLCLSINCL